MDNRGVKSEENSEFRVENATRRVKKSDLRLKQKK